MTQRRPLVLLDGRVQEGQYPPGTPLVLLQGRVGELPTGDTVQGASSADAPNFYATVKAALKVCARATLVGARAVGGVKVSLAPAILRTRLSPALAITQRVGGTAKASVKPGLSFANRATGTAAKPLPKPALKLVQTMVSLTRDVGASTVTQEAVGGRSDWATITNAQGKRDGTTATFAGNALGARGGQLVFAYPASASQKAALIISKVELRFYVGQAATTLANGTLKVGYRTGAAGTEVQLEAFTGDVNFTVSPRVYDLTSFVGGSWTVLDSIKAYINTNTALANSSTASCDAVEVHVEAAKNENQP